MTRPPAATPRALQKGSEPGLVVVLFVPFTRGDDVKDMVLQPLLLLTAVNHSRQAALEERAASSVVILDRHLFGLEHCLDLDGDANDYRDGLGLSICVYARAP